MNVAILSFGHVDVILPLVKRLAHDISITIIFVFAQNNKKESVINFENIAVHSGFLKPDESKKVLNSTIKDYLGEKIKIKIFIYDNLKLRSFINFKLSIQLSNILRKFDVIHINGQNGVLPHLQLLLFCKKIVYTIHDFTGHSGETKWFPELMNKITLFLGKEIIVQNKETYIELISKYHSLRNKIHFIPFGILDIYPRFCSEKKVITKRNTILFFGRISPYKGIEYLIEAAKIARKKIPDLKVIIAGSGEIYFDASVIKDDDTFQIIIYYIPNSELAQLIQESSFVVCPYTDATQSGVVMTAYAFYKPVIATKVGGLIEAVSDNVTGKLVPPKDSISLSKAIIELLKNPDKLDEMSENIKMFCAQSKFSWGNIAYKTIEVYKKTINKG